MHLVCGVWGTLAVGVFSPDHAFVPQLIGVAAVGAAERSHKFDNIPRPQAYIGIRVSRHDELRGLDISEHGMEAFNGFQIFSNE